MRLVLLWSLGMLAACAVAADRTELPDANAVPRLAVSEDLRIGSVEDPDQGFSRIASALIGPDRRIYVAEARDSHVRIYEPSGHLARVVGRRGAGPGEFRSVVYVGLLGDTLWVPDPGNSRITRFDRDGRLVGTVPAPRVNISLPEQPVLLAPFRLRADGLWASAPFVGVGAAGVSLSIPELLFDNTGAVVDTVRMIAYEVGPSSVVVDSISVTAEQALLAHRIVRTSDAGTVVVSRPIAESSSEGRFRVIRTDIRGDTVLRLDLRYDPRPVTTDYVAAVVEQLVARSQGALSAGRAERALRTILPRFHPPASDVWVGPDESLWIRREEDFSAQSRYLVIKQDGTLRGEVRVPRDARFLWAGGDALLASIVDSLGVPWLTRYEIR